MFVCVFDRRIALAQSSVQIYILFVACCTCNYASCRFRFTAGYAFCLSADTQMRWSSEAAQWVCFDWLGTKLHLVMYVISLMRRR